MTTTADRLGPPRVDPRAIVSPDAVLGDGVEVGPFAIVEAGVVVGAGTRVLAQAYVCSGTTLGRDNVVHMGVVLGHEPQDKAFSGEPTHLVVGDRNVFREGTQVHRGTAPGTSTTIGNDCYLMTNVHVAHNCQLEDGVILATGAVLGGHVGVGERAFVSGNAVAHQHTRIGRLTMLQGGCAVSKDVPPFCITRFGKNTLAGINVVGVRRAGLSRESVTAIRRAFRTLFFDRPNLSLARERRVAQESERGGLTPEVQEMLDFIAAARHGVCAGPPRKGSDGDADDV